LVDFLVIGQVDPETLDELPPFGVMNDDDGKYRKQRTVNTIHDALYIIKANAPMNTEMYSYAKVQLTNGKVKLLIDEQAAKLKLLGTKAGQALPADRRAEYLRPFVLTTVLREQLLNLVEENEGINIILKQSVRKILKDKASAFFYGLYFIKLQEDQQRNRRKFKIQDLLMMN